MDLGRKIYELRKKNNITQEQLAIAVGVTAPAVCKWETGVSLPDITLLSPIARKLNTNLNELLSFKVTLSSVEIDHIISDIKTCARQEGLNAGMKLAKEYLQQYPNVDELKLHIAMLPVMMAQTADDEYMDDDDKYQKLLDETTQMLEELLNSDIDDIRIGATACIITRYMEQKRLDEAEAILKKFPNQTFDARHLYPSLYIMKGDDDKVFEWSQTNMLQDIQSLLGDIMGQHTIYMKNEDFDKAQKCAQDYLSLVQIAGTSTMLGNGLLVDTYLTMGRIEKAKDVFVNYIDEVINIGEKHYEDFYYSFIRDKMVVASTDMEDDVRIGYYKYIFLDDRYRVLRESKEVTNKLEELKNLLSCK